MEILIFVISCFIIMLCFKMFPSKRKCPPGPYGVPILGYFPFLGSDSNATIQRLATKYGPIMKVNFLNEDFYFLNSIETVKEAFVNQADCFAGRPVGELTAVSIFTDEKGVATSEGEWWSIHHKFIIRKLSNLGMGKSQYEVKMNELCEDMVKYVSLKNGHGLMCLDMFMNYTANVVCTLLFSKNYKIDDSEFNAMLNMTGEIVGFGDSFHHLLTGKLFYWLLILNRKCYKKANFFNETLMRYITDIYKERVTSGQNEEFDDLLADYIREVNDPNSVYFDETTAIVNITSIFVGGILTSSMTLYRLMCFMALNIEIQKKVYQEIERLIGSETMISVLNKNEFHLTQAIICEVHRLLGTSFSQWHVNKQATTISGYFIPKRSKIIANIRCLSRDKRYFEKPDEFYPQNFLDENGNFVNKEANIPFSIGKRRCLGEKLAESEIFIAFVSMMRRFEWKIEGSEITSKDVASNYQIKLKAITRK